MSRKSTVNDEANTAGDTPERVRLDLWLFYTRLFKSRALASELISGKGVRVNGNPTKKPGRTIGPGDLLIVPRRGASPRVIRVLACGARRGPAPEAQLLYEEVPPLE